LSPFVFSPEVPVSDVFIHPRNSQPPDFIPSLTGQHGAAAVGDAAPAGEVLFDTGCLADIDYQTIIVREFLSGFDIAQGFKEDAVAILLGFQIGFAGVINPLGEAATVLGVDDVAIIQMEVESVVGLTWVVRVEGLSFFPGDDLSLVFQHRIAGLDGTNGVNTLAVDARFAHLDAAAAGRRVGLCRFCGGLDFVFGLHQFKYSFLMRLAENERSEVRSASRSESQVSEA
jgi:hypothetical protein